MSRSFFYHQQPFGELNWQRQSIFQPEECQFVCGVHAFDGNPSNNINSKKRYPAAASLTVDNIYNSDLFYYVNMSALHSQIIHDGMK